MGLILADADLEFYGLTRQPFAAPPSAAMLPERPRRRLWQALDHWTASTDGCLVFTGLGGFRIEAILQEYLRSERRGNAVAWFKTLPTDPRGFLSTLLARIGLEEMDGSVAELRRILQVYLEHQVSAGRQPLVVASWPDAPAEAVQRELGWVLDLRLRRAPVLRVLLIDEAGDLPTLLCPEPGQSHARPFARYELRPFSSAETAEYLLNRLAGAGGSRTAPPLSSEVSELIHAHCRGLPAAAEQLCGRAMADHALHAREEGKRKLPLEAIQIRRSAQALGMAFDPEAVRRGGTESAYAGPPRLRLQIGPREVREVHINYPRVVMGRDEAADVRIRSRYVSRFQALFMHTPRGWLIIDLGSTNGTFVNGRQVREHILLDGDVIAIGPHQAVFKLEAGDGNAQAQKSFTATEVLPQDVFGSRRESAADTIDETTLASKLRA